MIRIRIRSFDKWYEMDGIGWVFSRGNGMAIDFRFLCTDSGCYVPLDIIYPFCMLRNFP